MNTAPTQAQSVIVERALSHPPGKVWRALTQPHLMEAWLTASDFSPVVGHRFKLGFDWGDFPQAEDFYEHIISLPMFPELTGEQQQFIADTLAELLV